MNCLMAPVWSPGEMACLRNRLIIQTHFKGGEEVREECCPICLNNMYKYTCVYVPCKHAFHYKCLKELIEVGKTYTCPLCRYNFKETLPGVGLLSDVADAADAANAADGPANDIDNIIINMTIFSQMELYDFIFELLWRSYDLEEDDELLVEFDL